MACIVMGEYCWGEVEIQGDGARTGAEVVPF